jgi:glycosyltransferase involved in cell wall biosynthesis
MGIASQMLVQHKESAEDSVIGPVSNIAKSLAHLRTPLDHLPKLIYQNKSDPLFHLQWLPDSLQKKIFTLSPNIVHLNWTCRGFMNISTLTKIKTPIIWTLHDMWPFTGGCHYSGNCDQFKKSCGKCPQLGSKKETDLSRWTWKRKAKLWQDINLTLVAPSRWMKNIAGQSSLFQNKVIELIPNGVDLTQFHPYDRKVVRSLLGLSQDKKLILFGSINPMSDQRKGFHFLRSALQQLSHTDMGKEVELIIFGASQPINPPDFGIKSTYIGRLHDDISISLIYEACDVFVIPSKEDNLPNTIMEAMACGTPCVAFHIGGIPEMVSHGENGYLVEPYSIEDLVAGIMWVIEDDERHRRLGENSREKVESNYDLIKVAKRYAALYEKIIHQQLL